MKLCQVLLNLIVNAAQAMEGIGRPGLIDVRWAGVRRRRGAVREGQRLRHPLELHESVFEPLFTTKPVGVGTGLGLAICKDAVSRMGGTIQLKSQVGAGTTVEITVKRRSRAP